MEKSDRIKKIRPPWKGICVKSCWFAKHEKCKCRCKKQNHGKGLQHGESLKPEDKEENNCPKCGSKFVVAKPYVWSPEGKTTYICGICSHWWYKPKT